MTTWETTTENESITIGTRGGWAYTDYDFTIDWGDGTVETGKRTTGGCDGQAWTMIRWQADGPGGLLFPPPSTTSPERGAAIEVPETLAWSDSSSRYRYHLHLSSEPSFTDTLQYDSTLTAAKWELSRLQSLEKGATFYWRVRKQGIDDRGLFSAWTSSELSIAVNSPVISGPAEGAHLDLPVTLAWEPRPKKGYRLDVQIASDPDFRSITWQDSISLEGSPPSEELSRRVVHNLDANETYYWRIRRRMAGNKAFASRWQSRSFYVKPDFVRLKTDTIFTLKPNYVNVMLHALDRDHEGVTVLDKDSFEILENNGGGTWRGVIGWRRYSGHRGRSGCMRWMSKAIPLISMRRRSGRSEMRGL
ncbi:hypothetical protein [Halalkalibaculum sp. DA3122]|uniref:hypothetical protein n=1 Tax=Halalkalibaculum sp. DA3122 TaxID=3373607 RepID=UPI0037549327